MVAAAADSRMPFFSCFLGECSVHVAQNTYDLQVRTYYASFPPEFWPEFLSQEFRTKLILPGNDLILTCVPTESGNAAEFCGFRKMTPCRNRNRKWNAHPRLLGDKGGPLCYLWSSTSAWSNDGTNHASASMDAWWWLPRHQVCASKIVSSLSCWQETTSSTGVVLVGCLWYGSQIPRWLMYQNLCQSFCCHDKLCLLSSQHGQWYDPIPSF